MDDLIFDFINICMNLWFPGLARQLDHDSHSSRQLPVEGVVSLWIFFSSFYNQLPFSCDKTRRRLLLAALEDPRRRRRSNTGRDCKPCWCWRDAAVAAVLSELDVILGLKEEQKVAPEAFLGGQKIVSLHSRQALAKVYWNAVHRSLSQCTATWPDVIERRFVQSALKFGFSFTRRLHDLNPKDSGNGPSGVQGSWFPNQDQTSISRSCHWSSNKSKLFVKCTCFRSSTNWSTLTDNLPVMLSV